MSTHNPPLLSRFPTAQFSLREPHDLQDEIRVDHLCAELLQTFCQDLVASGIDPLIAGQHARGADYFLREFVIADRHDNLLELPAGRVNQFGGHWYIIRNLEPNRAELGQILDAVSAFYAFCAERGLVSPALSARVAAECARLDFYAARIEAFWAIDKDGYAAWEAGCPLRSHSGVQ